MKKVLVISNMYPSASHPSYGIFVKNQVEALKRAGIEVDIAVNDNPAVGKKNVITKYAKWAKNALSLGNKEKNDYTVTHAHYVFPSGMLSLALKKMFRIPYIVTAHGGDIERMAKKNERIRKWTASILQQAEHVIAVGPVLAEQIERDFQVPATKISILSMGVNRTIFHQADKVAVRQELQVAEDVFTFLFVGNVIEQKGVEELLHAYRQVRANTDRATQLIIVGSRRDMAFIERIQPLVDEHVRFEDPVKQPQLAKWFQAADTFVLPSHLEGFGLVALEALACGTPVIASQVGGLVSLLGDGAGKLVPAKNSDALREEMLRALHTPRAAYVNEQAVNKALTLHDEVTITNHVIALYESASKGGERP